MTVRLIIITFIALTLANAYSFAGLYSGADSTSKQSQKVDKEGNRNPAAIPPTQVEASQIQNKLSLDLNCDLKKLAPIKMKGQWAQLKGRLCSGEKLKSVEITNTKNGFTASVFTLGPQKYQTDLIQLSEGTNEIRLRLVSDKGFVQEQILHIESHM